MWFRNSRFENRFEDFNKMITAIHDLELVEFQVMMQAYKKYCESTSIFELCDEELMALPKEMYMVLLPREIDWIWDRLPTEYQEDHEMRGYRRCSDHYVTLEVDGPPPMRKDCVFCMRDEAADLNRELQRNKKE